MKKYRYIIYHGQNDGNTLLQNNVHDIMDANYMAHFYNRILFWGKLISILLFFEFQTPKPDQNLCFCPLHLTAIQQLFVFLAGFPEQKHPENIHHQTFLENCTKQNMKTKNTESNQDTTNATCCSDSKPCELKTWDQLLNGLVKGKHHILPRYHFVDHHSCVVYVYTSIY